MCPAPVEQRRRYQGRAEGQRYHQNKAGLEFRRERSNVVSATGTLLHLTWPRDKGGGIRRPIAPKSTRRAQDHCIDVDEILVEAKGAVLIRLSGRLLFSHTCRKISLSRRQIREPLLDRRQQLKPDGSPAFAGT